MCRFAALLRQLDSSKAELGVRSYGLTSATLEEVFLRIAGSKGPAENGTPYADDMAVHVGGRADSHDVMLTVSTCASTYCMYSPGSSPKGEPVVAQHLS